MEITLKELPANTQTVEYNNFIPVFIGPYLKDNKQYVTNNDNSGGKNWSVQLFTDPDYEYYQNSCIGNIEYLKIIKNKTDITINDSLPYVISISPYIDLSTYKNTITLMLFDGSDNVIFTTKITPVISANMYDDNIPVILDSICKLPNGTYKYILISKVVFSFYGNIENGYNFYHKDNGGLSFYIDDDIYQNKLLPSSYITYKTYYTKPFIYNSYINNKIDFIEPYSSIFSLCKNFMFINNVGLSQDIVDQLSLINNGYYVAALDTSQETVNMLISSIESCNENNFRTIIVPAPNFITSKIVTSCERVVDVNG